MRSLDSARDAWSELQQYQSLQELKEAVRLDGTSSLATIGGRSASWKAFLLFEDLDIPSWTRTLTSSRSAYNSLRSHFLQSLEDPSSSGPSYDPLSEDTDDSILVQRRKDEELRGEILQDVVRCMPENLYFRQPDTQRMLVDLLFVYCKLNPDISYRQGMHELLAPVLWVVERDAIEVGQTSKALGEDATINHMFDADHIEHDTFALFAQIMQSAKNFYEQTTISGRENPMVVRSRRIFNDMLRKVDKRLAKHLESIDILPQIFLMRWIRLLFGREFSFDDLLTMWDIIFAEDTSLDIVDHICIVMLLRIRWQLIVADYNEALSFLLRYPEVDKEVQPQTFALDAIYLRDHLDSHGGSYLVLKHTGRPIHQDGRPATPPALQRKVTTFSGPNAETDSSSVLPSRGTRQTRNIEVMLQSTAKNIYNRGEKLGIGQAVRSAVGEVQRKAQEIRETQTPSPPVRRPRRDASYLDASPLAGKVHSLEQRSKQLAALLEAAVGELWDYQKLVAETSDGTENNRDSQSLEKLSIAIAKVQFVQVYLDDPALPLPEQTTQAVDASSQVEVPSTVEQSGVGQEVRAASPDIYPTFDQHSTTEMRTASAQPSESASNNIKPQPEALADPSVFEDYTEPAEKPEANFPRVVVQSDANTTTANIVSAKGPIETHKSRPPLEQSSYSWMLGEQDLVDNPLPSASPVPSERNRSKSSLFRDDGDGRRTPSKGTNAQDAPGRSLNQDEEVFDMSSLRHGKRRIA